MVDTATKSGEVESWQYRFAFNLYTQYNTVGGMGGGRVDKGLVFRIRKKRRKDREEKKTGKTTRNSAAFFACVFPDRN